MSKEIQQLCFSARVSILMLVSYKHHHKYPGLSTQCRHQMAILSHSFFSFKVGQLWQLNEHKLASSNYLTSVNNVNISWFSFYGTLTQEKEIRTDENTSRLSSMGKNSLCQIIVSSSTKATLEISAGISWQ
jgi:hypothetical protein